MMNRRNHHLQTKNLVPAVGAVCASLMLTMSGAAFAQTAPAKKAPPPAAAAPAAPAAVAPAAPRVAAPAAQTQDGVIVAKAGDHDLTREDVRAFVATLPEADQVALARDPALFSQTLRILLANQLVLKEATAKKWDEQAAVAAQIKRAKDNLVVETYLQAVSAAPEGFPSESEMQQAYEAAKPQLIVPRQFQVAQIFVAAPEGADKETIDKAGKKLAEVQAKLKQPGADFAAIAKADSDERASAERGGEIGWLAEAQLRPEMKAAVVGLAKGAFSEPVKGADGWHVLKLIDTKAASTLALADVRDALAQRLRAQRAEAVRRAYLAKLLEQSPPTINELALSQVLDRPRGSDAGPAAPATPR
jgi:parvulin-like peptidyl-prolyl isomerase